jgi:NitT/TauT family transport system substrate-binding protein
MPSRAFIGSGAPLPNRSPNIKPRLTRLITIGRKRYECGSGGNKDKIMSAISGAGARPLLPVVRSMVLGSALALALALAASGAAQAQGKPWRHSIIEPKSDAGFVVMVTKGGFAQKQGLQLELIPMQSDPIQLRALLAGEVDSYEAGIGAAAIAASRNVDVKIMGCQWQTVVHSVFARAEIGKAADLKGKTFAISAPGAVPDVVARIYLAQNNIADGELSFASLGTDPDRYKAMLAGIAAATVVSIEFEPIAAAAGIKLMARGGELAPKFLRSCMITTGRTLATRRDEAVRFMTAEMQALRYALDHRDEEIRLTRETIGIKPDDPRPAHIFDEATRPTGVDPTMPISLDKIDWMQDQLIKMNNMSNRFDSAKMVDGEIRKQALARAGLR